MISDEIREKVRHRADFACEYCGVTEIQADCSRLTIFSRKPEAEAMIPAI